MSFCIFITSAGKYNPLILPANPFHNVPRHYGMHQSFACFFFFQISPTTILPMEIFLPLHSNKIANADSNFTRRNQKRFFYLHRRKSYYSSAFVLAILTSQHRLNHITHRKRQSAVRSCFARFPSFRGRYCWKDKISAFVCKKFAEELNRRQVL